MAYLYSGFIIALVIINSVIVVPTPAVVKNLQICSNFLESPHWSPSEQVLYFVDNAEKKIFRLDHAAGNFTSRDIGYGRVTLVTTVKDAPKLVMVTVRTGIYFVKWDAPPDDESLRQLTAVDLGQPDNLCNDGKVDAKGRFWFGTMGKLTGISAEPDQGSVYMIDENNYASPVLKVKPVTLSNGIAFSPDQTKMYYIDSPTKRIDMFDFDLEDGKIGNRQVLFKFSNYNVTGFPDGMTVDTDGNLWVACFNGGQVIKVDPKTGKLLDQIKLPANMVTSVMFGGPNLDILYVTTSRYMMTCEELAEQPGAGCLYEIRDTGSTGLPENQFLFTNALDY